MPLNPLRINIIYVAGKVLIPQLLGIRSNVKNDQI